MKVRSHNQEISQLTQGQMGDQASLGKARLGQPKIVGGVGSGYAERKTIRGGGGKRLATPRV